MIRSTTPEQNCPGWQEERKKGRGGGEGKEWEERRGRSRHKTRAKTSQDKGKHGLSPEGMHLGAYFPTPGISWADRTQAQRHVSPQQAHPPTSS